MLEQPQTSNPQNQSHAAASKQQASEASQKVSAAASSLTESADQALQSVGTLYNAIDSVVSKSVRESPYVTLAAAAGVGFVLGGGMRSPFGQVLMRVGVRAFGPPLVSAALAAVAERAGLNEQEPQR